jgi:ABC-type antimicrobial peptide transport system permease subunit
VTPAGKQNRRPNGGPLRDFALMIPLLLAAALIAGFVPALRASRVDPVKALRQE